jgi:hypothetical protein
MTEISIYQAPEGQELETIRKGNQLIEARYNLSAFQQLLLVELLPQINTYDEDFQDYKIDIAEFAKTNEMGQNKELYKRVQEALESLVIEPVRLISGDYVFSTAWLSSVKYRRGRGYADVSFHPDLKPLLLLMKSHYTEYPAHAIKGLRSKHSFRFYDWLASYKYKGNGGRFYRIFTVAEIREKLALRKGEYKYFKDLRVYAIEPALKDINDKTDLRIVEVEYIKNGRFYDEIKIIAEPKTQRQLAISEDSVPEPKPQKEPTTKPEEQKTDLPIMDKLITAGISINTAKKWLDKFGDKRIKQNLAYSLAKQKEGKVKTNFVGYLAKAIEEDWGSGWEDPVTKAVEAQRKSEATAYKKQRVEDEKAQREREEKERVFAIFEAQSESLQDVILDAVEDKVESAVNAPLFIKAIKDERKKGKIKSLLMKTNIQFMEAMRENGLID